MEILVSILELAAGLLAVMSLPVTVLIGAGWLSRRLAGSGPSREPPGRLAKAMEQARLSAEAASADAGTRWTSSPRRARPL